MSNHVEWKIEVSDNVHSIVKSFDEMDSAIFSNREFMRELWYAVFKQISEFIKKRFDEGKSSWKPLTPKYEKWKEKAVANSKKITAGSFGKRVCKLNEMGRLTNTMFTSATSPNEDGNIFEIKDNPNFTSGSFRYAISGSKLPYATYFDNVRPFFFLTQEESEVVLNVLGGRIANKIDSIWNKVPGMEFL